MWGLTVVNAAQRGKVTVSFCSETSFLGLGNELIFLSLNDSFLLFLTQVREGQIGPSPCQITNELSSLGLFGRQHSDSLQVKG